ncbi:Ig-like domain-containing protein [Actinomadura vinacea]|uniref:Ig-like domain-containing protein n=1 Tax=Actinomadura vinacea TaxID=115336 RepID=A0ABN3K3F6_9ACTN
MRIFEQAPAVPRPLTRALLGCSVLLAAACQTASQAATPAEEQAAQRGTNDTAVTISPANGAAKARPDRGVVVRASNGTLGSVSVRAGGRDVAGSFNAARTEWRSRWTLAPATSYAVTATAKSPAGKTAQAGSTFRTLKPARTVATSLDWILEGNQRKTYGVGTPIILNFDRPVLNKKLVEKALEVRAEKPVEGAWRWVGDRQVIYRTRTYWPAHQKVTVTAHMAGVRAAKGVYGLRDFTRTFTIGAARISRVDLKKHRMVVSIDGRKARTVPISAGNGTTLEYTTTSGVHLTMEKGNPVRMIAPGRKKGDPGYYDEMINWAVRISNSGEYLHQSMGEYGCLGKANCSHGCVRQHPRDATWFYRTVQPGDVVTITGSRRKLEWNNGWSFWQLPWASWRKGSALN